MSELEQQKAVDLDRGLFFVNYKSAEDSAALPTIVLSTARAP